MWKELQELSIGVFDSETDGFLKTMTQVHCITCIDALSKYKYTERADTQAMLEHLDTFEVLAGHNLIGFDLPMLEQQFGWKPRPSVIILDTLWMSRMYNPGLDGGHSLGSWGVRLGNPKTEYYPILDKDQPHYDPEGNPKKDPGWTGSIWTSSMEEYCEQDVSVNVDVFWKLCKLLSNFSWESIRCEMLTAALIQRQMEKGWVFNLEEAEKFHATLFSRIFELEEEVHNTFKPVAKLVREVQPKVKKDGTLSSVGLKKVDRWEEVIPAPEWEEGDLENPRVYTSGSFSLIEWPEFSLGSRQQIAERLLRTGYKLTKKTDRGNYIIDDVVLKEVAEDGVPEAKPLAEYFLLQKLEAMVKSWIEKAVWDEEHKVHRIHGYVNSMGANSHRMTHSNPNVAQVPSGKTKYGKICRGLFGVPQGYKLVGCDASGLELRTLAHYMKDPDYIKTLLEGDIHTVNQLAAGLPTRDAAKTFNKDGRP